MTDPIAPLTGRCMCETVQFEVSEPLLGAIYCHCYCAECGSQLFTRHPESG